MNISSKDRQLGNQINQIMNEYNNITNNFYESKKQLFNRNRLINYNNINNYNFLNRNNSYKSPYNDYDLQNRITNSLYPKKNRSINIKKFTPSQSSTLSNNSINYRFNNNLNPTNYTNNIIQDFKTTLRQTQALTNKIMTKNNFYPNKYSNKNNYDYNYNMNMITNSNYDNSNISKTFSDHSALSEENSSSINLDDISDDSNNIEEINDYKYKYKFTFKKDSNEKNNLNKKKEDIINIKKEDEDKLKLSNQILKKSNFLGAIK